LGSYVTLYVSTYTNDTVFFSRYVLIFEVAKSASRANAKKEGSSKCSIWIKKSVRSIQFNV
jgi:hypothetical protein